MRYWDEVVTGAGSHEPQRMLDASLTSTVLATHRGYEERAADPAFSARELTGSLQGALTQQLEPVTPEMQESSANGRAMIARPSPRVEPRSPARRRLALGAVCTLLVLAGLIAGYVAFTSEDDGGVPSIPAVIEGTPAATPVPDLASQTLLEHHFAAGELAVSDEDFFIWNRYSLAPGSTLRYPNACGAPKITFAYVESGTFVIRADGPLEVTRDGTTETIPAGAEVSQMAGDSYLYLNTTGDQLTGFRNPGPEPLVVTEAIWRLTACVEGPPVTSAIIWDAYDYEPAIDPSRPVVVTLRRITALPGVVLSEEGPAGAGWLPGEARILERIYVEAGNLKVNKVALNASGTPSTQQEYRYPEGRTGIGGTFTLDLDMDPAGTTFLLDNAGSDPLVITVFTVAYEDIDTGGVTPSPAEP
jgi:hypothetical protein